MRTLESILSNDLDVTENDIMIGSKYWIIPPNGGVNNESAKMIQKHFRKNPPSTPPLHNKFNREKGAIKVILDWIYCAPITSIPDELPKLYKKWWPDCPTSIYIDHQNKYSQGRWELYVSYKDKIIMIVELKPHY